MKLFFVEAAGLESENLNEHLYTHISEVFALGQAAIAEERFHCLRSAESGDQVPAKHEDVSQPNLECECVEGHLGQGRQICAGALASRDPDEG